MEFRKESSKSIDSSIKTLEELNACDTFIEYFYVFGAREKTVRTENFYQNLLFKKPGYLKMQLLSKFPPFEKPNSNVDENVILNHCFPTGYNLLEINDPNQFPKHDCFHFSLDNLNSLGYDDKKIYFTCLLFYERLTSYYELLIRIQKNPKNNQKKLKPLTKETKELIDKYYVPKVIVLSSFVPFPNEEKYLLNKLLTYVNGMTKGVQSNIIIPIEKVIEKLVLGIPRPPKGKFYVTYRNNNCIIPSNESDYDIKQRELNQYNFYSYKMHLIFSFKTEEIIEIIKCLLLEIPILFFSKSKEKLTNIFETFLFLLSPFEYQYPHVSILPDINAGIIEIAKTFAFGINYEWVESDEKKGIKNYFEKMNINVFNKLIKIVDIDNRKITKYFVSNPTQRIINFDDLGMETLKNIKDDFSSFIPSKVINHDLKNEAEKYELPFHYASKFKNSLNEFLENNKIKSSDCNMTLNRKIGEDYFYLFFVSVFQNYNKYLFNTEEETKKICKEIAESDNYDNIPIDHLCKTGQFLKEFKVGEDQFLNAFFQTKIFKNFMIRKYLNNNIDKFIFLHFDEAILSKRNRSFFKKKVKTEFLESKILQATHSYGIDTTKNFSQEEYSYISDHKDNLINYYQRFNGIMFRYYLFPKLIYDNKYFQKLYIPPKFFDKFLYQQIKEYQKAIESLEQPKYFKIYEGTISIRHLHDTKNDLVDNEIKDDIILLWLRIFCFTFYYCETKEKIVRFVEMLKNLKKAYHINNDILNLLLITIKKYGDDAMTINLFQKIKNFNYSQFAHMSNKLFDQTIVDTPQLKQLSMANAKLNINYFKDKEDANKIFELNIKKFNLKHRTFWNEGMENKSEKIKFENPKCPSCKKANSLKTLIKGYEKMNKNKELRCIHCKKLVNMTTKFIIGDKIRGKEVGEINLYNPYYLYNNISTQLIKIYGNKIDLTDLRNNYKDFFWNCILNFKIAGLSCDMLLKYNKLYKVKIEEEKKEESDNKRGKQSKDKSKENSNENKKKKIKKRKEKRKEKKRIKKENIMKKKWKKKKMEKLK